MEQKLRVTGLWPSIKTPQKSDGSPLWWSVLTFQDGCTLPDGREWNGSSRKWFPATDKGMSDIRELMSDTKYHAVYISQSLFFEPKTKAGPNKTHANKPGVACLTHAWVDIDAYKVVPRWLDMSFDEQASLLVGEVMLAGLPVPSLVVSSGRGAYLIWRLEDPIWNISATKNRRKPGSIIEAINRHFARQLLHIGSDMKCVDMTRVLRAEGSRHTAITGATVRVIHDSKMSYSVADLRSFLPWSREQVKAHKTAKKARKKAKVEEAKKSPTRVYDFAGEKAKREPGFTGFKYAHLILTDLRKLADLRWCGEVAEGYRDAFAHLAVSAVARYHKNPETLLCVAERVAGDIICFDEQFSQHNQTAVELLKTGRKYAYSAQAMSDMLNVTPSEAEHLFVLCPAGVKNRRKQANHRRKQGAVERETYNQKRLEGSLKAQKPWEELGISRATYFRKIKAGLIVENPQETAVFA